jgi:uncharacterized protein RhaS with RHS repeats
MCCCGIGIRLGLFGLGIEYKTLVITYGSDAAGNRSKQTDANGKITYWVYDDENRVLQEIRKVGDTSPTPVANVFEGSTLHS